MGNPSAERARLASLQKSLAVTTASSSHKPRNAAKHVAARHSRHRPAPKPARHVERGPYVVARVPRYHAAGGQLRVVGQHRTLDPRLEPKPVATRRRPKLVFIRQRRIRAQPTNE